MSTIRPRMDARFAGALPLKAPPVSFTESPDFSTRVEQLVDADLSEWDEFAQQHPWGLVYHLSGWRTAVEEAFPHIRGRIIVIRNSRREIVAGIPVYEVRSLLLGNRTVSIPFATLCDPLASSEDQIKSLMANAPTTSAQPIRIGAWRAARLMENGESARNTGFSHHFLSLEHSFESVQQTFSKTAVRQMVLRAQRSGITVELADPAAELKAFYQLYYTTRRRLGLPAMPLRFFESLSRNLGAGKINLLFARQGEELLAGVLAFAWKDMVLVECLGESAGARKLGANQLLWWDAIRRACEQGYSIFSFGRTHNSNKGLMEFKRRWGTREEGLFAFAQPAPALNAYNSEGALAVALRRLTSMAPTPIYNGFSAVCYRHLG